MKDWPVFLLCLLLSACATEPVVPPPLQLFSDHAFHAPSETIGAAGLFALSPAMKRFLDTEIAGQLRTEGPQHGLLHALTGDGRLRLEYESALTRNAAQTFAARSGNCLSLVIMAAAFGKALDLPVIYQHVSVDETWSREGDILISAGHVNLSLGKTKSSWRPIYDDSYLMTIDFLPPEELSGQRTRAIEENTIVAMYLNNRAAEELVRGRLDDAYWWVRDAILRDPRFLSSHNTLAIIYRRHGNLQAAERVLEYVLQRDPDNVDVMSNLALVLHDQGRIVESATLERRVEQIQPFPPFYFFNLGRAAMRKHDYLSAKTLFAREVDRAPYYHEFHFWLAAASYSLGEFEQARKEMALAVANSTTRKDHDLYAAKLDLINASRRR